MQASQNFAQNLRAVMEARNISQREMAEMCGVTYAYVNRILLQKQNPSINVCDKIADALDMDLSELLSQPEKLTKSA